jgi:hypothetical protein
LFFGLMNERENAKAGDVGKGPYRESWPAGEG